MQHMGALGCVWGGLPTSNAGLTIWQVNMGKLLDLSASVFSLIKKYFLPHRFFERIKWDNVVKILGTVPWLRVSTCWLILLLFSSSSRFTYIWPSMWKSSVILRAFPRFFLFKHTAFQEGQGVQFQVLIQCLSSNMQSWCVGLFTDSRTKNKGQGGQKSESVGWVVLYLSVPGELDNLHTLGRARGLGLRVRKLSSHSCVAP